MLKKFKEAEVLKYFPGEERQAEGGFRGEFRDGASGCRAAPDYTPLAKALAWATAEACCKQAKEPSWKNPLGFSFL